MAAFARSRKESLRLRPPGEPKAALRPAYSRRRNLWLEFAGYLTAAALSSLFVACAFSLWRADLSTPWTHFSDALLYEAWIKGIFEHGWYLHNPNLGAPAGMDMHDFPMSDGLHFLLIKMLCFVLPNYAAVFNVFYLLGYPLAAVSALFLLRRFEVSYAPALLASLLFALLPYHFFRGQLNLFLSSYYVVPLSILVALWLYLGRIGGSAPAPAAQGNERRRLYGSLAIAALQSSAGVYYAFFACFLLLMSGFAAALEARRWRPFLTAGLLIGVTTGGVLLNVSPSLHYWSTRGRNPDVARRHPIEAEMYGVKIAQLLLPDPLHRIPRWSRMRQKYDTWPLGRASAIGAFAGVGFLFLIGSLFYRRRNQEQPALTEGLAILNLSAVLLATIGGFGTLFNFLIYDQFRGYERIGVFVAMFSLFASALLVDRSKAWWFAAGRGRATWAMLLTVLSAASIADAAGLGALPNHAALQADFENDAEFARRIEAALPPGSMVFQLPYFPFPETPPLVDLQDYEKFRPYFHANSLRFSYGAMKGREEDAWQRQTSTLPIAELVATVAERGFAGIYIDRLGYQDRAAALEAELTGRLGQQPIVSGNARLSFFALPQSDGPLSGDARNVAAQ